MVTTVLNSVALLGSGVTTGVFVAVAISIVPALRDMDGPRYIETNRLLGRNWDPTMPVVVLATVVCDAALAGLNDGSSRAAVLGPSAAALMLAVAGVSHLLNVPINKRVNGTSPQAALEPHWNDPRPVWRRWHWLRTGLAGAAFVLNIAIAAAG